MRFVRAILLLLWAALSALAFIPLFLIGSVAYVAHSLKDDHRR